MFPSMLYKEREKKGNIVLHLIFMPSTIIFFQNTLYYLPGTGLSLIVENHGKYAMLRSLFRESILSISLGVLFIKTPFRTSQGPTQIPESAMQLEDLTPQFLTVAPHLSYHKNVTLVPPINATQTVPG